MRAGTSGTHREPQDHAGSDKGSGKGKKRPRGKRGGNKVRERQERARQRSERADRISDSELPPSQSPDRKEDRKGEDRRSRTPESESAEERPYRRRERSRTPIRRTGSPRPSTAPDKEFYIAPRASAPAPPPAAGSRGRAPSKAAAPAKGSRRDAPARDSEDIVPDKFIIPRGSKVVAPARGVTETEPSQAASSSGLQAPGVGWEIQEIVFKNPEGKTTRVKYDQSTGLPISEVEQESEFQVVGPKRKKKRTPTPPVDKPPAPKTRPKAKSAPEPRSPPKGIEGTSRPPIKRQKQSAQQRESAYPGKEPSAPTENRGLTRAELQKHLQAKGIRGSVKDQTAKQQAKSDCSTCVDRRKRLVPALKKKAKAPPDLKAVFAGTGKKWVVKKKKVVEKAEGDEAKVSVWKLLDKTKQLAQSSSAGSGTERVAEVPPPPEREASDEEKSSEPKPGSSQDAKQEVEKKKEFFTAGIDYHGTLDPELIGRSQEHRQRTHTELVKAAQSSNCTFFLHSFSGRATGEATVAAVESWERECEGRSGARVFKRLSFEHSIIRTKFGKGGKADVAQKRGYKVLFDDDAKVLQEAERRGIYGIRVTPSRNFGAALKHFVEKFAN